MRDLEIDDDDSGQRYRAPALEKGLDILEQLARSGAPMTTKQISGALGKSVSELFRMIQVLQFKGYISESGEGYELTSKLFTLGLARAPLTGLTEEALPHMRALARRIRQSCHLAVQSDEQMVVIARVENPGYFGYSVRTGHRRDLTNSTSGVILYAFQPEAIQQQWAALIRARAGAAPPKAFLDRVKNAVKQGYWSAESQLVPGVTDIATPVHQGDAAVASLTVPYIRQANTVSFEEAVEQVKLAAKAVSDSLARAL